ncbi:hypothetical protein TSUD_411850 [Trifolium subterraneum]|uniref:Uncharacterized protein n=1 Tax=Trifolium subterraneum TaxID=3900 RepID=A0A2Z6P3X3_TRISU|nr:hypothetical protein TSUD_411850 [Trifolium subterraneum]
MPHNSFAPVRRVNGTESAVNMPDHEDDFIKNYTKRGKFECTTCQWSSKEERRTRAKKQRERERRSVTNCDANLTEEGTWGLSAIFRDDKGNAVAAATWKMAGFNDPAVAEAMALCYTLCFDGAGVLRFFKSLASYIDKDKRPVEEISTLKFESLRSLIIDVGIFLDMTMFLSLASEDFFRGSEASCFSESKRFRQCPSEAQMMI